MSIFYCKRNYWWRIRHFVDEYYTTGCGSGSTCCCGSFNHIPSLQNPKTCKKALLETRKVAYRVKSKTQNYFLLHSLRNRDDRSLHWKEPCMEHLFHTIEPKYMIFLHSSYLVIVWTPKFKLLLLNVVLWTFYSPRLWPYRRNERCKRIML